MGRFQNFYQTGRGEFSLKEERRLDLRERGRDHYFPEKEGKKGGGRAPAPVFPVGRKKRSEKDKRDFVPFNRLEGKGEVIIY